MLVLFGVVNFVILISGVIIVELCELLFWVFGNGV